LQEDANWQLHDEIPKFERNSKAKIQWDLFELPDGAMAASIATQAGSPLWLPLAGSRAQLFNLSDLVSERTRVVAPSLPAKQHAKRAAHFSCLTAT